MKVKILSTTLIQLVPENDAEVAILKDCHESDSCFAYQENLPIKIDSEQTYPERSLIIKFKNNDE